MLQHTTTRRLLLKSSIFGLISAPLHNVVQAGNPSTFQGFSGLPHDRYPAIPLDAVSEVVGLSHFDLDKVKALVENRKRKILGRLSLWRQRKRGLFHQIEHAENAVFGQVGEIWRSVVQYRPA